MASNATTHRLGRVAQVFRHLQPSARQLALFLTAEVALALLGVPLWLHVAAAVIIHLQAKDG